MIHIRTDHECENVPRRFACGIGPELPPGDKCVDLYRPASHYMVDCPGCKPHAEELGIPLSQITGQQFQQIAASWGYQ